MNFSTATIQAMSKTVAAELSQLIEAEEITDLMGLENGIGELLKTVGRQAYGQVLETENERLGSRLRCECGRPAVRVSKRTAKVLTVFGRVSYRRGYYGCRWCGEKQHRLDQDWGLKPGEVSPVLGKLLAIAGVDIAFERAQRTVQEFILVRVSENTIRKHTQQMGQKQAQREAQWIRDSQDEAWLQDRERTIASVPERDCMVRWMVLRSRLGKNGGS